MKATNIAKLILVSMTLSLGVSNIIAQEEGRPRPNGEGRPGRPEGGPRRGPGPDGGRFRLPIMEALDPNGDGIISQEEIANAPKALAKMDKNKDGQITPEEYRPARRPGGPGGPGFNRGEREENRPRPERD